MWLLDQKHLQDEKAAYAWVEDRVWPNGPICSHCGDKERVGKMQGKATRIGLYKCYACRRQFNVKIDTIFELSHVPMHIWLQAFYLIAGSKKGISSNQLHRTLGVTLKTAWFMGRRIREALRTGSLAVPGEPIGGKNKIVEADDTYVGGKAANRAFRAPAPKKAVLSLVERKGEVRSFHVPAVNHLSNDSSLRKKGLGTALSFLAESAGCQRRKNRTLRRKNSSSGFGKPPRSMMLRKGCQTSSERLRN